MIYGGIAVGVGLLACALFYVAFKLLKGSWLLGWLRGSLGLSVLAASLVMAVLAWDISTYAPFNNVGGVATVSFSKQGEQQYRASVVAVNGAESLVELQGELWRIDLRGLHWSEALEGVGLESGYRLSAIVGRYLSLEQEQQSDRVVHPLLVSRYGIDGWRLFERSGSSSLVAAELEESAYFPMVDNGIYKVGINSGKLDVIAVNEPAKNAMALWE